MNAADVPADGEVLTYSAAQGKWVSQAPPGGGGASLPAGIMAPFGGAAVPAGWLPCDGSAVSRATYSALFNAIGTAFGAGDGSTTFNVPDLRGRAPIGAGQGPGLTSRNAGDRLGAETHTNTLEQTPPHSHTVHANAASDFARTGASLGLTALADALGGNRSANSGSAGGSGGVAQPHNNMPPSVALNFIVKT